MPRLIAVLIRHGDYQQLPDSPSAHQPFPLTDLGISQASNSALELNGLLNQQGWQLISTIDSSHLLRAWHTADIMSRHLSITDVSIAQFIDLSERAVGNAANLTQAQITQVVHEDPRFTDLPCNWKSDSHFRLPFPGAESLLEAGKRVADHLQLRMAELREQIDRDSCKLFIGHGAAFRHAAYHLGVLELASIATLSMYHCRPILLEVRPDNSWTHIHGEWKIRTPQSFYTD